ncbi:MAG: hypothetical protein HUJ79_02035, partial [Firmicutes bacterium]|nr:hypothetical protein [Bacillota bacterium]
EEEGEKYCSDMANAFRRHISHLSPGEIDLAFLLLDGRLGNHAYDGMDEYLEALDVRHVIPIHQWRDYRLTDKYMCARKDFLESRNTVMHKVTGENCVFEID